MNSEMEARVAAFMKKQDMVCPGDRIAVAISGGADSVCLFRLLLEIKPILEIGLSAVHVNHGLRQEADEEEKWVRKLCEIYKIPLQCFHVKVRERMQQDKSALEEAARNLRYEVFEQIEADKIALAHHRRDQAETVLQHLLRGSGLRGLGGMRPVRGRYIRPLLEEDVRAIREYNRQKGQEWMEDRSNGDLQYQRNRIRHQLLPELTATYNPAIEEILGRTAAQLQQDEDYLQEQAEAAWEKVKAGNGIRASETAALPAALAGRIIRLFLKENGIVKDISAEHTQQVLELCREKGNRRINLPGGLTLIRSYDILEPYKEEMKPVLEERAAAVPGWFSIPGEDRGLGLEWTMVPTSEQWEKAGADEEWIRTERTVPLTLRTRRPGDYIMAAGGRKRLQDYFVDAKIPAGKRDHQWLLAAGNHVLWILRQRLSDGARICEDTEEVLHAWLCTREEYEVQEKDIRSTTNNRMEDAHDRRVKNSCHDQ